MSGDKNTGHGNFIKDIVEAISSIRFGYVQIVVHDSKVVQIDKTEKIRFDGAGFKRGGEELKVKSPSGKPQG